MTTNKPAKILTTIYYLVYISKQFHDGTRKRLENRDLFYSVKIVGFCRERGGQVVIPAKRFSLNLGAVNACNPWSSPAPHPSCHARTFGPPV